MPKKKKPDLTPEEQFKRFEEAAKEHEIEKRLPEIEQAFGKLSNIRQKRNSDKTKANGKQ